MSNIFISYSSSDRDWVHVLANALKIQGYSVWFDPEILPGQDYEQVIQNALHDASCVIVVWSQKSSKSRWVKAEASQALERNVLVPVSHENTTVPMPFNTIQTSDLDGWSGDTKDARFQKLLRGLALHCKVHTNLEDKSEALEKQRKKPRKSKLVTEENVKKESTEKRASEVKNEIIDFDGNIIKDIDKHFKFIPKNLGKIIAIDIDTNFTFFTIFSIILFTLISVIFALGGFLGFLFIPVIIWIAARFSNKYSFIGTTGVGTYNNIFGLKLDHYLYYDYTEVHYDAKRNYIYFNKRGKIIVFPFKSTKIFKKYKLLNLVDDI